MARFSTKLTKAQAERLICLAEELSEAVQAVTKILRHGYDSYDPRQGYGSPTNRTHLEKELGDVRYWMIRICDEGDISKTQIHIWAHAKSISTKKCLHFQK